MSLPLNFPVWPRPYLGLRFKPDGEDRAGISCAGLVRLVLGEQAGIWLPAHNGRRWENTPAGRKEAARWFAEEARAFALVTRESVRPLDVVRMRSHGLPVHVGIIVEGPWMLHVEQSSLSCVERWDRWPEGIESIHRHAALA